MTAFDEMLLDDDNVREPYARFNEWFRQQNIEELAAKIAKAPLITLQATKAGILRAWENMGFRTHQQASNDLQAVVTGSKEFQDYMVELMKKAAKPSDRV